MLGFCEGGPEPSGSIKCEESLGGVNNEAFQGGFFSMELVLKFIRFLFVL